MKNLIKNNLKYLIFLAVFGIVGGYFTSIYSVQSLSPEMLEEALAEIGSIDLLIVITTAQSLIYALIFGILGKILATKIGLWRKITFEKNGILEVIITSLAGGVLLIYLDIFLFNNYSDVIRASYEVKPSIEYIIASLTYGAVVEEVMLRLFLMSLVSIIVQKTKHKDEMDDKCLIIANVISAILFASGHLPATAMSIGLTPIILCRCFLLNGGIGLLFGRLYRKYGIHYAMLAHGGVHIISKLILLIIT